MNAGIERRLQTLEQRLKPKEPMTLHVTFVRPSATGPVDLEPVGVRDRFGWQIDRLPGETAEALRERAEKAAPRAGGVAMLYDIPARAR